MDGGRERIPQREKQKGHKTVVGAVTTVTITSPKNSHSAIPGFAMDGRRFSCNWLATDDGTRFI